MKYRHWFLWLALCLGFVYDVEAQTVDLQTYYAAAEGKAKGELKNAMHEIIAKADVLGYSGGEGNTWFGFYYTDRYNGNQVRDRYSNDVFFFNADAHYNAVTGMNIEHSFPKSWWGGENNQAYKDIHHLMPCEAKINQSKNNYAMGKVTSVNTNNGCTKVGKGPGAVGALISLWEPADKWKGDFARAVFYMVTCYQDLTWQGKEALGVLTNTEWPTLQPWAYELYLQWNRQDPVDDIERTRNEVVYRIQHNRNPFIDIPELADYIWGSKTETAFSLEGSAVPASPEPPADADSTLLYCQTFKVSGQGNFTTVKADGTQSEMWRHDTKYGIVISAFDFGKKADEWLISPALDLTNCQGATVEFRHAVGYHGSADPSTMMEVLVSSDYAQRPSEATWTPVQVSWPTQLTTPTSKFTRFESSGRISLDDFAGEVIHIAFHYKATSSKCWTWEIDGFKAFGKPLLTGIDDNYMSPMPDDNAVFDLNGCYVGQTVPARRGIYIVRENGYTYKRFVK